MREKEVSMPRQSESSNLREYARVGARQRLTALNDERQQILALFPELRRGATVRAADGAGSGRRMRRSMSAAQRKAVGERMKAYWAKRRAQKANGPAEGAQADNVRQDGHTSRKAARKQRRRQGRKK
jgi:hypothetical protein